MTVYVVEIGWPCETAVDSVWSTLEAALARRDTFNTPEAIQSCRAAEVLAFPVDEVADQKYADDFIVDRAT